MWLGYRFAAGAIRELLEMGEGADTLVPELARGWTAYLCFGAQVTDTGVPPVSVVYTHRRRVVLVSRELGGIVVSVLRLDFREKIR